MQEVVFLPPQARKEENYMHIFQAFSILCCSGWRLGFTFVANYAFVLEEPKKYF